MRIETNINVQNRNSFYLPNNDGVIIIHDRRGNTMTMIVDKLRKLGY